MFKFCDLFFPFRISLISFSVPCFPYHSLATNPIVCQSLYSSVIPLNRLSCFLILSSRFSHFIPDYSNIGFLITATNFLLASLPQQTPKLHRFSKLRDFNTNLISTNSRPLLVAFRPRSRRGMTRSYQRRPVEIRRTDKAVAHLQTLRREENAVKMVWSCDVAKRHCCLPSFWIHVTEQRLSSKTAKNRKLLFIGRRSGVKALRG